MPAKARDQPRGGKAARRRTEGKAAKNHRNQKGATTLGGILRYQRADIGHRRAESQSGHKTEENHLFDVLREGGDDSPEAKEKDAVDDDFFSPQPVGERPGEERPQSQANQRRADDEAELVVGYPPFMLQRRGDKPHNRNIKTVERNHAKA